MGEGGQTWHHSTFLASVGRDSSLAALPTSRIPATPRMFREAHLSRKRFSGGVVDPPLPLLLAGQFGDFFFKQPGEQQQRAKSRPR